MDELIGKVVGGCEILRLLGEGGMAKVYLATQQSMNRFVALKVLPRDLVKDDTYYQRFEREVRIVSQLEHRNIVPVYDYGKFDAQPFIVMRYMPAGSVDDLVRDGALPLDKTLSIIGQIAPALDYAHSKEVLHRDLKPGNVLMDDNGGAYLTDFGIARLADGTSGAITTQGVVGTPSYMSPEQAQGKTLDSRSDVYSLGVMLFEMATGRRPFENDTPYSIAVMQVTTPPPMPRAYNPSLSTAVESVILRALRKLPDERYSSAGELALALKIAIESPGSLYDTEPNLKKPGFTASPAQPGAVPQPIIVSSAVAPVQPAAAPPAYAPAYPPSQPVSHVVPAYQTSIRPTSKPKRQANPFVSVLMGSGIGCALLAIIAALALLALNLLGVFNPNATSTEEATTSRITLASRTPEDTPVTMPATDLPSSSPFATLNPTAEAARATLLARTTQQTTPIPTPDTSVGTGGSLTAGLPPALQGARGVIVYAGQRETDDGLSFEIIKLTLADRQETRLTNSPGDDSYPVVSPDGQWIAFQSDRDGDFDIYVMTINGGQVQKLTDNTVIDRLPGWSPDSQHIVYSSDVRGDGDFDIFQIARTGGDPQAILSSAARKSHPRYSPDGRYIVFTSGAANDSSTWEIQRLDLTTGEVLALTSNNRRDASPVFSPDGQSILYITMLTDGSNNAIGLMSADGSSGRILFNTDGSEWAASYSPDGAYIVFASNQTGSDQVYLMTAAGTDAIQISPDKGGAPGWVGP